MINYYTVWMNEESLITILQALKPLDKDMKIIIVDKIIDYQVNKEIADTWDYEYYDDYDYVYHDYADYDSDSYNTD